MPALSTLKIRPGAPVPTSNWLLASKASDTACVALVEKNFAPLPSAVTRYTVPLSPVPANRLPWRSTASDQMYFSLGSKNVVACPLASTL